MQRDPGQAAGRAEDAADSTKAMLSGLSVHPVYLFCMQAGFGSAQT